MSDSPQSTPAGPSLLSEEASALPDRLASEMAVRWRRGERPRAEEFLDHHPELWQQPESAAVLIYEEFCLRHEYGEAVDPEEVLQRFPNWRSQIEVLLQCHELLAPVEGSPAFPCPGETLG